MSKTLRGNVDLEIDGETYQLRPTLAAVRAIEARFGGLRGAAAGLHGTSVDAVAIIIAAGANLTEKQAEALPEKVWQHGVATLVPEVYKFLGALYNPRGDDLGKPSGTESAP
ncbi:gene transfer agent family protein [Pseudomonas oryzihabitans]|uniref:gene transfer agent family protein n=1 Tax=Pseudomonas oryzihabitans TaxID=47885 RepID=UPI00119FC0F1|nr:gene transfer agent family protein [Pseudomonas oryzihabitans]